MTVDGREDLFNYTYLNANGYLDKFRAALHAPSMTLPNLAALLKTFDKQYNLKNFITKNSKGKYCLYYKQTLDRLLGLGPNGRYNVNPALEAILQKWNENEISRKNYGYEPANYASDEEDMQKMSDMMANLEEAYSFGNREPQYKKIIDLTYSVVPPQEEGDDITFIVKKFQDYDILPISMKNAILMNLYIILGEILQMQY